MASVNYVLEALSEERQRALAEITAEDHVVIIATHLDGQARTAAFAYAKAGNHIVIASDNDEAALLLARELSSRHVDATFVHADTRNAREIAHGIWRVIDLTEQHYGHIDVQYRQ